MSEKTESSARNTVQQIFEKLPKNFDKLDKLEQFNAVVLSAETTIQPVGNWILVNGDLTVGEFLGSNLKNITLFDLLSEKSEGGG